MEADTDTRNQEIRALAAAGIPHTDIARKYGISRQRITQLAATPPAATGRDADIAAHLATLRRLAREADQTVRHPPPKSSAIGKIVRDDNGNPVPDLAVKTAAIRESRMIHTRIAQLQGLDQGHIKTRAEAERECADAINAIRARRAEELAENATLRRELEQARRQLAANQTNALEPIYEAELVD